MKDTHGLRQSLLHGLRIIESPRLGPPQPPAPTGSPEGACSGWGGETVTQQFLVSHLGSPYAQLPELKGVEWGAHPTRSLPNQQLRRRSEGERLSSTPGEGPLAPQQRKDVPRPPSSKTHLSGGSPATSQALGSEEPLKASMTRPHSASLRALHLQLLSGLKLLLHTDRTRTHRAWLSSVGSPNSDRWRHSDPELGEPPGQTPLGRWHRTGRAVTATMNPSQALVPWLLGPTRIHL